MFDMTILKRPPYRMASNLQQETEGMYCQSRTNQGMERSVAEIDGAIRRLPAVPTVDVIIPCYNYGHFLNSCVESVLAQQGVNVSALIIDDASPDNTAAVAQELAARHDAVKFRRHTVNKGHIATYNEGLLDWSTADYVALLSADDMLAPGALERAVRIMEADKSVGMVYGRTLHFEHPSELPQSRETAAGFDLFTGNDWIEKRVHGGNNVITSPEVVVRGSIQKRVGGYRPELPHSGDLEMWMRIAAISNIAYVRQIQAYYRVHSSSMQRTKYQSSFVDLVHRKAAFDRFFEHHPSFASTPDLHQIVNRTLAREALWDACRAYDHNHVEPARIGELVQFAIDAYSGTHSLPEYSALKRRQRLGASLCNLTQIFIVPASIRWLSRKLKKKRMLQYGI
jgi:glycosyltransferase involved in cell wall biosynthesis